VAALVHQIEVITRPQDHEAEHKDWHCTETLLFSVYVTEDHQKLCYLQSLFLRITRNFVVYNLCYWGSPEFCYLRSVLLRISRNFVIYKLCYWGSPEILLFTICVSEDHQKLCCLHSVLLKVTRNFIA
jgi:hypothetical protein